MHVHLPQVATTDKGNSTLLGVIQEDQLDDGWSPVLREALVSTDFLHR